MYAPPPPRIVFPVCSHPLLSRHICYTDIRTELRLHARLNIEVDAGDDVARNASYEGKTAEFHMYFYNIKLQVNKAQALLNVDEWFLLKM